MSNLESNTNNLLVPGLFVRGDELTRAEAQSLVDAGEGENVIETVNKHFYEKEWLDGRSTLVMNSIVAGSGASTTSSAASSATTDGTSPPVDEETESTVDNVELALAPEVEKLEALAGQLETAADGLKAEHDTAAVEAFESAAGKVARAAEEVRENPTDEDAIEEFETATDELKNAAHALEGDIGDEQYQQIVSAVNGFEKAADHMLAADDGEADMAHAVSKASSALETLLGATTDIPGKGGEDPATDLYKELEVLSNQLVSLSNDLMDKVGIDEMAAYEDAMEQLEDAFDNFNADPTSEPSIEGLEKASDSLKSATAGLEGKLDASTYQALSAAVNGLESAARHLLGSDGEQAEVDKAATDIKVALESMIQAMTDGIEVNHNTSSETDVADVAADKSLTDLVKVAADLKSASENLSDLFDISALDAFEAATVKLAEAGEQLLADGSQDSIDAFETAANELKTVTHDLEDKLDADLYGQLSTAVDGFEAAADKAKSADDGADDRNAQIVLATESLQSLTDVVKDAVASKQNSDVVVISEGPLKDLGKATNALKAAAEDVGAIFGTSDLDAFEAATVTLEAVGDSVLKEASQDNIDAFEAAANELKAVTHGLEGKIDAELYGQLSTAVDGFEAAVDQAVHADDGVEDRNAQIVLATASLQSLIDQVNDAVVSKQSSDVVVTSEDPLKDLGKATNTLRGGGFFGGIGDNFGGGIDGASKGFNSIVNSISSSFKFK